ncbi:MAG: cysteine hydrolase family protein [Alphaproteobacteria bacterium]|nr:cysteine hydrolase family protein [Alphaproteobacteria bacterium]
MAAPQISDLLAKGRAAFVMTEVQPGVIGLEGPWPPLVEAANKTNLVANCARIAAAARTAGAPVFHCTADSLPGSFGASRNTRLTGSARKKGAGERVNSPAGAAPFPETWEDGDILMPRFNGLSCMHGTALDQVLRNEGITTVVVTGVSLAFGVLSTSIDVVDRGYQLVIPTDAVAGFPEDYAKAVVDNTLMMIANLTTTDAVVEAWTRAGQSAGA